MPELKQYRVFISHAWGYSDDYNRCVDLLNSAPLFSWANHSVTKADPLTASSDKKLVEALKNQVRNCHVVVILSGMYAAHSNWIQKEIDIANEMGKPIVAVKPWGSTITPNCVNCAKEIVSWQSSSIVDAIRKYSL